MQSSNSLDRLSVPEILHLMNEGDSQVPAAVGRELPNIAKAVDAIVTTLRNGGHLYYLGAGTSGRLGVLDASECPPTFDVPADLVRGVVAGGEAALSRATEASEDDASAGVRDLQAAHFTARDVLVGIAASGRTPYVLGAVRWARDLGASTIGISCVADAELSLTAEIAIEAVTGPEIVEGSTRLRAGTATKLVLNMLSTAAMIQLGHVYGNLMVNVRPTNQKLRARACGIIARIAGVPEVEAGELLDASGGHVRTAIIMHMKKLSREQAGELLRQHQFNLRSALEADI